MVNLRKPQQQLCLESEKVGEMQPRNVEQKRQYRVHTKTVFHSIFINRISTEDGSAIVVCELMLTDVKVRSSEGGDGG